TSILRSRGVCVFAIVCLLGLLVVVAVIFVEQAQRRIPVQYAKRQVGRRMCGASPTYIPLKVTQAGVIPIIFASTLLYLPTLLTSIVNRPWLTDLNRRFFQSETHPVYMLTYFLMIIAFAYFYN